MADKVTAAQLRAALRRVNQPAGGNKKVLKDRLKQMGAAEFNMLYPEEQVPIPEAGGAGEPVEDETNTAEILDVGFAKRKVNKSKATKDATAPVARGFGLVGVMYMSYSGKTMHAVTRKCMVTCKSGHILDQSKNHDPSLGECLEPVADFVRRFVAFTADEKNAGEDHADNFARLQHAMARELNTITDQFKITDSAVSDFFEIFATLNIPNVRRSSLEPSNLQDMVEEEGEKAAEEGQHETAAGEEATVAEDGLPSDEAVHDFVAKRGFRGVPLWDLAVAMDVPEALRKEFHERLKTNELVEAQSYNVVAKNPPPRPAPSARAHQKSSDDDSKPHSGVRAELRTIRNALIARCLDWIDGFPKITKGEWPFDFNPDETGKMTRHIKAFIAERELELKDDQVEAVVKGILLQDQSKDRFPVRHGFHESAVRGAMKKLLQQAARVAKSKANREAKKLAESGGGGGGGATGMEPDVEGVPAESAGNPMDLD